MTGDSGRDHGMTTAWTDATTVWTDADLDTLSWHDCHIHGIELRTGDPAMADWTSDLALDLDFIVGGSCGPRGEVVVMVAPATLAFHDVTDLRIAIEWAPAGARLALHTASIAAVSRRPDEAGTRPGHTVYAWTIDLNWPEGGSIRFGASGFTQQLRAEPVDVGRRECLTTTQRRGL